MKRIKIISVIVLLLCVYGMWVMACGQQIYQFPKAAREDISKYYHVRSMTELTEEDMTIIYEQTGVAKPGVETLVKNNQMYRLNQIQQRYFEKPEIKTIRANLFCHQEWLKEPTETAAYFVVEDGDIIITLASYLGGWRYGHSGLVLDAAQGSVLEAVTYGEPSGVQNIRHWGEYPTFVVLRPKRLASEEKQKVITYARNDLQDIAYDLLSFKTNRSKGPIKRTHCSHLVWYAYHSIGVDLDRDGTPIVTPYDILYDDDLEVVQVYGQWMN